MLPTNVLRIQRRLNDGMIEKNKIHVPPFAFGMREILLFLSLFVVSTKFLVHVVIVMI